MKTPTPNNQSPTKPQGPIPNPHSTQKAKPFDIRERTLDFASRILDITASLPPTTEAGVARQQLAKAGTSVGANVEEADGAATKADRRKSLVVARKECRETRFWLRLIERKRGSEVNVSHDIAEAVELTRIPSTIIEKLE